MFVKENPNRKKKIVLVANQTIGEVLNRYDLRSSPSGGSLFTLVESALEAVHR